MRSSRSTARFQTWAAVLCLFGCQSDPVVPFSDFDAARTSPAMSRFLGGYPSECISGRPGIELCQWTLDHKHQAWDTLARSVPTHRRLNVVCALPTDGTPRSDGSCRVHPLESRPFGSDDDAELAIQHDAQEQLVAADDLVGVSQLVGALPDQCRALGKSRVCTWQVTNRHAGYALLAAAAGASGPVRLECRIPGDTQPDARAECVAAAVP